MDTNGVQVKFPDYVNQMFGRIKSILALQVYDLPEMTLIASNNQLSDEEKFALLRDILKEFKQRYCINVSIYEFCRYRNVRIPKKFKEIKVEPLLTMDFLTRMMNERIHSLEEMASISRNDTIYIEKEPMKVEQSKEYWQFQNTSDLRKFRENTECCRRATEEEMIEEEKQSENEDFEIINYAEPKEEDQMLMKENEREDQIIRINTRNKYKYSLRRKKKRKRKINKIKFQEQKDNEEIEEREEEEEEQEEEEEEESEEIKSKYKKVENLYEDRYWNTLVDLNIHQDYWINIIYRSPDCKSLPDMIVDAIIGDIDYHEYLNYKNAIFIRGEIRNMICSKGSTIDTNKFCNQNLPEPDILIESKYWKLLRYRTEKENEALRPYVSFNKKDSWMKLTYQKLDMNFRINSNEN